MKVFHLFISKSSDGLLGLDDWCEGNSFLLGALGEKKRLVLVLQNSVIFQCCWSVLSLRNMVRIPLWLFSCHPMVITYAGDWFPPCPTRLLWETVWRLSSPWGQRMSWVGRGRRKRRGAALLACQQLSQLGKWVRLPAGLLSYMAASSSAELVFYRERIPFYMESEFSVPSDTTHSSSRLSDCYISLSDWNILFMLFSKGHWQKRLVCVGPAVNSLFCLKHFVACASLWRTWVPSG